MAVAKKPAARQPAAKQPAAKQPAAKAAGYSGTPLPQKLGMKERSRVALVDAPKDFAALALPAPRSWTTKRAASTSSSGS